MSDHDPNKAIAYMQNKSRDYAKAEAQCVYLENGLKQTKAKLMNEEEGTLGNKECYALAHPDYEAVNLALKVATEEKIHLKWMLLSAQAVIECYKVDSYLKRQELKQLG